MGEQPQNTVLAWIMYASGRELSSGPVFPRGPPPITVLAVADPIVFCLFIYANEWQKKKSLLIAIPAVAATTHH